MAAPVAVTGDHPLSTKCLDLCQALTSQGKTFTFTLTIGSSFTFSLDTRVKDTPATTVTRKHVTPSTRRRNERRKEEFLKKKALSAAVPEDTPVKASENEAEPKENNETVTSDPVGLEQPAQKQPASQLPIQQSAARSQPWRRPSTCRRCGLNTKGHPGPYGEERCRIALSELPSRIRIEKCSECFDCPRPPCETHRKPFS